MTKQISILLSFCFIFFSPVLSWNNHAGITYLILLDHWKKDKPKPVVVESLNSFLQKEKKNIQSVLDESESWSKTKLPHLTDTKPELKFSPKDTETNLVPLFLTALRTNPHHKTSLYIQKVGQNKNGNFPLSELTDLNDKGKLVNESFLKLKEGEFIDPLDVIVTAVDEPDYDLDLYLFEDSDFEHGKLYGFGEQPFGNPKFEYSSQAPFHMGFYYEPSIIFTLAGFLKKTYPEYRIHQFTKLSEYAFKTGHKYWGYRFAGWALHYIQDLTQPYHSSVLPRVGASKQIGVQLISMVGISSPKANMIEYVTNRHTLIEEYQYYLIRDIVLTKNWEHPVSLAIQQNVLMPNDIWSGFDSIRGRVAKEAFDAANSADEELEKLNIEKYEKLYEVGHPIHGILSGLLKNTSTHTRLYLNHLPVKEN